MQTADAQLARIEGQIRGLRKMITADRPCEEVMQQLMAVRNSLTSVGNALIQDRIQGCQNASDIQRMQQSIAQLFKIN